MTPPVQSRQGILAAALEYYRRGWAVIPVPAGMKRPVFKNWPQARFDAGELARIFAGEGNNIAVILGEPSDGLVDIDLDAPEAAALAPLYLPPTEAIYGRASKPASHWLYQATPPLQRYKGFADPGTGEMLLEYRTSSLAGAHQSVLPPSQHASGEMVTWQTERRLPARIEGVRLWRRAALMAIAVLVARHVSASAARDPDGLIDILREAEPELAGRAQDWLDTDRTPSSSSMQPPARRAHQPSATPRQIDLGEMIAAIPNALDWHDWNRIGMTIFSVEPSLFGKALFDQLSAKSPKYRPAAVDERWRNYSRSPPSRLGIGTLIRLAAAAGWRSRAGREG